MEDKKIKTLKAKLEKAKKNLSMGHNFIEGKPILDYIKQLEYEIYTRTQYGDQVREAFTK